MTVETVSPKDVIVTSSFRTQTSCEEKVVGTLMNSTHTTSRLSVVHTVTSGGVGRNISLQTLLTHTDSGDIQAGSVGTPPDTPAEGSHTWTQGYIH